MKRALLWAWLASVGIVLALELSGDADGMTWAYLLLSGIMFALFQAGRAVLR